MNVMIRRAGKPDLEAMVSMLSELFAIETDFVVDAEKQRDGLSLLLSDSDRRMIFVAVAGNVLAGMVTAQLVVSTASGGHGALLEDLFVREAYRRSGVGSALVDTVKEWAAQKDARRIQLLADRRNRSARAFYTRHGFFESSLGGFYLPLAEVMS